MRSALLLAWISLETLWNKAVSSKWSPLVFAVSWFGHECSVCTSWRAIVLGAGVALLFAGLLKIGALLILLVLALVAFEWFAAEMKK